MQFSEVYADEIMQVILLLIYKTRVPLMCTVKKYFSHGYFFTDVPRKTKKECIFKYS